MADEKQYIPTTTISKPDRRYWAGDVEYGKKLSGAYSIGILALPRFEWVTFPGINPGNQKMSNIIGGSSPTVPSQALFKFPTPPQSYEVVENAATTIVPTQGGGKFVESHGNIFKEIRISGTVGLRPSVPTTELFPGLAAAGGPSISKPSTFLPDFLTKDSRGLDPSEVTGFDDMMFLRNIFRAYFDLMKLGKTGALANETSVMVWMYAKESEAYVVEPISFTTLRDRSNPLSWNYNIQLRSLYKLDLAFTYPKDPLNIFQKVSSVFNALREMTDGISRALTVMANLIDYVANIPSNLITSLAGNFITVLKGIALVRNTAGSFPDVISESTLRSINSVGREIIGLFDEINGSSSNPAVIFEGNVGKIRHSFIQLNKTAKAMLTMDALWKEDKQIQVRDYSRAYLTETGKAPQTAGSPLNPSNIKMPDAAVEVEINGFDTIRSLALQHLGDEAQWKKLAIMNNLKPPYIAEGGGDGILAPGDTILVPRTTVADEETSAVARTTNADASSSALRPILRSYGRDLLGELGDLAVASNGDLDMVEGVENVIQAVKIKFGTEQGELPTHPTFGAKYPVGTKVTLVTIQEFAINSRRTFKQDPRVEDVRSMNIWVEGDVVYTDSRIKLVGSGTEVPFTFSVRR